MRPTWNEEYKYLPGGKYMYMYVPGTAPWDMLRTALAVGKWGCFVAFEPRDMLRSSGIFGEKYYIIYL